MPVESHPSFIAPASATATIWRYMDLAKFLSLLERSALYFPRVDKLAVADPYEGYYTNTHATIARLDVNALPEEVRTQKFGNGQTLKEIFGQFQSSEPLARAMRETTFVNSWHMLEHESAAMWALYLRSEDGIAVRSTYQRLVDCFKDYKDFEIHIGLIKYIDYERDLIPLGQAMFPMMHKRKSFEHEHELRALIWTVANGRNELPLTDETVNRFKEHVGLYVDVALPTLIDRIYVAPTAPSWIVDLLKSLLKKYSLDKLVIHSRLADQPLR